jgi:transcriptional regulator GlxA family with amidase domain
MQPKRIGFFVCHGIQALDVVGPMDAFAAAEISNGESRSPCYELVTVGLTKQPVSAGSGLLIVPGYDIRNTPPLDTFVIPGGSGVRDRNTADKIGAWIKSRSQRLRRIVAVCTGVYGLAASGLLAGRRVTTHWRYARDLKQRYPLLNVDPNPLFIQDGAFYTSGGITAGIDLSLALIADDFGPSVALAVARDLLVYLQRSGDQSQYSEPLQFQTHSADRVADVARWISGNLSQNLSVERLAMRVHLSSKQFTRRFAVTVGTTPATFVETARLDEARRRLIQGRTTIGRVATSVGFRNDDVFRRRFALRFGLSPSQYRSRFGCPRSSQFTEKPRCQKPQSR